MFRCSPFQKFRAFLFPLVPMFAFGIATPGFAQNPAPPPVFPAVDANGVDVSTGTFVYSPRMS